MNDWYVEYNDTDTLLLVEYLKAMGKSIIEVKPYQ